jgi:hypothetical protein
MQTSKEREVPANDDSWNQGCTNHRWWNLDCMIFHLLVLSSNPTPSDGEYATNDVILAMTAWRWANVGCGNWEPIRGRRIANIGCLIIDRVQQINTYVYTYRTWYQVHNTVPVPCTLYLVPCTLLPYRTRYYGTTSRNIGYQHTRVLVPGTWYARRQWGVGRHRKIHLILCTR